MPNDDKVISMEEFMKANPKGTQIIGNKNKVPKENATKKNLEDLLNNPDLEDVVCVATFKDGSNRFIATNPSLEISIGQLELFKILLANHAFQTSEDEGINE